MPKVIFATGNSHKVAEVQRILASHLPAIELLPQSQFGLTTPPETGATFLENAHLKARYVADQNDLPVIAEDSGLEVAALDGQPGIYSSRYAGEACDDQKNIDKLLTNLQGVPEHQRSARFCCAVVCLYGRDHSETLEIEAHWEGRIAEQRQGKQGFGYDPIFYTPEQGCTAAELTADQKNALSHRAQAFTKLASVLKERLE